MLKTGSLGRFDALAISCRFIQVDLVICVTLIASKGRCCTVGNDH